MKKDLIRLIANGIGLEDAAGKCGHDEELSDWRKAVREIKKKYGIRSSDIDRFNSAEQEKQYTVKKQKHDVDAEAKKKRDAEILAEFGITQ